MRRVVVPVGLALNACAGHQVSAVMSAPLQLPAWDAVPSPHPPGATNPPSPVLLVLPFGVCFKEWVSPFLPPELHQDRVVEACPSTDERVGDCGTPVQCPPQAAPLLEAWKAEHPG